MAASVVPFPELGRELGLWSFVRVRRPGVGTEPPGIPLCASTGSAFVLLGCLGFPGACVTTSVFFPASRAPQRAATPPRKTRTSKVGAGPGWGRDAGRVPGARLQWNPCLSAPPPRAEMGGSIYSRGGCGLTLLSVGHDGRLLSVVAGLGKGPVSSGPKSGIAELELLPSLSRARAQRPVPVAENAVSPTAGTPGVPTEITHRYRELSAG